MAYTIVDGKQWQIVGQDVTAPSFKSPCRDCGKRVRGEACPDRETCRSLESFSNKLRNEVSFTEGSSGALREALATIFGGGW